MSTPIPQDKVQERAEEMKVPPKKKEKSPIDKQAEILKEKIGTTLEKKKRVVRDAGSSKNRKTTKAVVPKLIPSEVLEEVETLKSLETLAKNFEDQKKQKIFNFIKLDVQKFRTSFSENM